MVNLGHHFKRQGFRRLFFSARESNLLYLRFAISIDDVTTARSASILTTMRSSLRVVASVKSVPTHNQ